MKSNAKLWHGVHKRGGGHAQINGGSVDLSLINGVFCELNLWFLIVLRSLMSSMFFFFFSVTFKRGC